MSLYTKQITVQIEVEAVHHDTCESMAVCDEKDADMFSVYLRTSEGLASCIADFNTKEKATAFVDKFSEANIPSVEEIVKDYILYDYFSEVDDEELLLKELTTSKESEQCKDVVYLIYGEVHEAQEDKEILNMWNDMQSDARALQNYIKGCLIEKPIVHGNIEVTKKELEEAIEELTKK